MRRGRCEKYDMKKFTPFLLTLLIGILLRASAVAQSYPVQTTVQLTPPYSLYLADYAAPGSNRIMVNVLLRDLSRQDLQTRLRLTIEGVGISITTRPDFRPHPLYLQGGLPLMLDAIDLAPYFDPQNLVFQGISKQEVQKGGRLPEGLYRICIQVLDYNLGAEVSNQACGTAWLILNDPPIINLPRQGEKLRAQDPQNILFQWTPRHTGSPNSAFNTEYDFQLVELWPDNRDPNHAILSTPPIFETTTFSTSLLYGPAETPLEPGRRYAFRVRARAMTGIEGMDLFKNDGYSEVHSFTYGDACTAPMMVAATALSSSRIEVRWDSQPFHTEFTVRYREKSGRDAKWQEKRTYLNDLVVDGLLPQTEYEFQVLGICGSLNGVPSETVNMATSEVPLVSFTCGSGPGTFDLENQAPLEELNRGDVFRAGDVEVTALEVKGGNGTFSGTGLAEMPWLRNVKLRVEFSGIFLNTDHQLLRGSVKSVFNPDSKMIVNLDGMDDLFKGRTEEREGEGEGAIELETNEEIVFEGVIDSVYVDEKGEIVIIDTEGERTVYAQPVDPVTGEKQAVNIVDGEGNGYVVDKDGNVSQGSGNSGNAPDGSTETDSVLFVQKELIKEVLEYYKEEINLWLENNGKGPLDEALIRRLMAMPDCLPKHEEELEAVLAKVEEYLEDPEALLELVKEDDANKARIEELTAKLTGNQPPYAAGLSETEWGELLEMLCPYLLPEEEEQVEYHLPLTVYLDDDYYLIDPEKTEFSKGDTITVESFMAGTTLFMKDAEGQSVELLSSHFPDNAGEAWPPGFTVNIEELEEGEIEEVKILIPRVDTLLVYIEKYKPALEMGQSDILALLSDINAAQKDDKTTCDLSARLTNYSEGVIAGDLGKVKVNEKYEVQSLKLKLTHQSSTEISLEDVDITIKEDADKDKEIVVFTFSGTADGETVLELTAEKKDREFLEWYLLGVKPVFKITTTYIEDDDYTTVSSFTINRGDFSGYFLERPEGTAAEERTEGSGKRIPEGDYKMCYTYKQCRSITTRSNADNETWILTNGETDNSGATITRNYVLIHIGNYPWHSAGCLLIGSGYSDHTLEEDYNEYATGILYEKDLVVKKVTSSGDKLTALNNEYKKLIDLAKKFDDDCENNKCYELEIDINR